MKRRASFLALDFVIVIDLYCMGKEIFLISLFISIFSAIALEHEISTVASNYS